MCVQLGGEDFLKRVDPAETRANLTQIVTRIQAQGSAVLLLTVPSGLLTNAFESQYRSLASQLHTAYVENILHDVLGHPELMWDPLDPNDAGYLKITDRIEPELRRCLAVLRPEVYQRRKSSRFSWF